jgi:hypothetical protein
MVALRHIPTEQKIQDLRWSLRRQGSMGAGGRGEKAFPLPYIGNNTLNGIIVRC